GSVQYGVVVAVAGSRNHLQAAGIAVHGLVQQMIGLLQIWRLADYCGAHPWELLEGRQEPGGHLRNVDGSTSEVGQPVEIADVFLVRMSSDHFCDSRL